MNFISKNLSSRLKKIRLLLVTMGVGIIFSLTACSPTPKIVKNASGAQLWASKCQSCHNAPPANQFSPQQWDVIIYHMKTYANLTPAEEHKILNFLKQR